MGLGSFPGTLKIVCQTPELLLGLLKEEWQKKEGSIFRETRYRFMDPGTKPWLTDGKIIDPLNQILKQTIILVSTKAIAKI